MAGYRTHLQAAVATSAAPYGYTLTVWTSGAVAIHARGVPTTLNALMFLAGAVAGFAAVGAIAHGSAAQVLKAAPDARVRLWGGFHLPSVGAAIGAVALVTGSRRERARLAAGRVRRDEHLPAGDRRPVHDRRRADRLSVQPPG